MATSQKVTYTSTNVDLDAFHHAFDDALNRLRSTLGKRYPLYINGQAVEGSAGGPPIVDTSPIDTQLVLGTFAAAGPAEIDQAVRAARAAQKAWARLPWRERLAILRKAAAIIRERKFDLAATMSLEVGKSRLEAMGDAEESADLIDYYAQQVEDANGFVRSMAQMTPIERNTDVLRPYGVFACIAPFNFPLALSTGMSSAALMVGNAVVYKPALDTPLTGLGLYEVYRDAGVPAGVFHFLSGHGAQMGDALWKHPGIDGIVFTGSKEVGLRIYQGISANYVKPCLLELGGKNATIVMDSADLDAAAEGVMRSAFSLQNQKCSATSRVYVHKAVAQPFLAALKDKLAAIKMGDPTEKDVFFGPVINAKAVARWEAAVNQARQEGTLLTGGTRLLGGVFDKGHFVTPTIATLPLSSSLFMEELFVPFLAVGEVESLDQALAESNKAEYGLTAGFFSRKQDEIDRFFDEIEAGVCYVNKRTGATTGAWPGAQPFTGWKGSGSTGKGGCGPYYVQQFMREQSRTVIEG
ncbi:MAG TPA: aldehyde dehydrogenase family protein [Kofleriaceae bacterium]|jgi:1-pyrroline-5-carboxylate dehydrogenase|nr:aldehyde dehydrogenase family protein [Kofleriaceae bacterium]